MRELTCVDLFSGAGGLSRGFLDAGYDVVLGVDYDDAALKTFKMNHGNSEIMKLDLFNHDNIQKITDYLTSIGVTNLDVLVGGPPCQGFSIAGPRDMNDKRNRLYLAMVKLAEILKPQAVVLENVPGMIQTNNGIGAKRIVADFKKIGYNMKYQMLYAPDFGIPQIRKRVFFVGLLDNKKIFEFPNPVLSQEEYITCEEAISDLPTLQTENGDIIKGEDEQDYLSEPTTDYQKLMRKNSKKVYNHLGSIPIEKTRYMISLVPEGKNYRALPEKYRDLYKYHEALTRYHSKKPSLTINTGHRSHFHYKWNRIPTVRESARLQSFPDDFIFYGNRTEQYKQVGNAVPPLLGKAIANQLKGYLDPPEESMIRIIDLFAGCGGLTEGFMSTGFFQEIASVEWLKPQVDTLRNRLKTKWNETDADESVMRFDIQREEELFHGWENDPEYGSGKGIDYFVNKKGKVDVIIGGPPCQAYSVAGRVRDENGMKDDYRNYLFEHYLSVVKRYQPKLFIFENVPGILSATPDGTPITERIVRGFNSIGFEVLANLKDAMINASDFGVPQNRNRIIILGVNKDKFSNPKDLLTHFYKDLLPRYKTNRHHTVREAIGDLPPCMPFFDEEHHKNKQSHNTPDCSVSWHTPRYSNLRDMDTFRLLAEDLASGRNEYNSKKISELYEEKIGSKSPIHRYHVLNPDLPSTTIIAHLYKDGNRFIHYDSSQQRTITPREAARIQSFPDDFEFIGKRGSVYQMVGNAVPPLLAKAIANSVWELLKEV